MTHARMWVGAVVVVGWLGVLALSGNLERGVGVAGADSAVKKVECEKGQTLTEALQKAKPGDTLQVTATCHERVTITTDRLTLDGDGCAVLDGGGGGPTELEGVVTIDGAHGVALTGFTIQHGPGDGILGIHGAAFAVQQTTVQNNGTIGIAVADGSTADLTDSGSDFFGSGATIITAANNGADGILVSAGFIASPFGTAKFILENNITGLHFIEGAGAVITGGLSIQNNGTGVSADGAGTLALASIPTNPSVVENNGTDVDLTFGTRATFDGVTIGTITCDATVLSRGTTVCP
jgi:hypothetical protein